MRRILALSALGLLGAVLGCHTAGICDCEGILDPCGGPPTPFGHAGHHGGVQQAGYEHALVGTAPGSAVTQNAKVQETPLGGEGADKKGEGSAKPTITEQGAPVQVSPPTPMVPLPPKL
jgi:hypothetical protein